VPCVLARYKQVKMEAADILNATKELFLPGELLCVTNTDILCVFVAQPLTPSCAASCCASGLGLENTEDPSWILNALNPNGSSV